MLHNLVVIVSRNWLPRLLRTTSKAADQSSNHEYSCTSHGKCTPRHFHHTTVPVVEGEDAESRIVVRHAAQALVPPMAHRAIRSTKRTTPVPKITKSPWWAGSRARTIIGTIERLLWRASVSCHIDAVGRPRQCAISISGAHVEKDRGRTPRVQRKRALRRVILRFSLWTTTDRLYV